MGTGASAKRYRNSDESSARQPDQSRQTDDSIGNVRPCDSCGETRRTARFGGEEAQWLCAACQLSSGTPVCRPVKESQADAPRPKLARGYTMGDLSDMNDVPPGRRSRGSAPGGEQSSQPLSQAYTRRRARRGAKERNTSVSGGGESQASSVGKKPSLMRSNTTSLDIKPTQRSDYRSLQGLQALKEQMGVKGADAPAEEERAMSPKRSDAHLPSMPKRRLAAGFCYGDVVFSLISRLRGGSRVLELGNEGTVVGAARSSSSSSSSEEDVRLLIQFKSGVDWYLPPTQISASSSFLSAKASGLPGGYSWGSRVQSLVTYLKPPGSKKEIWLGDAGTVVGPGHAPGKLAVRFDDAAQGEWSIWPKTICQEEEYDSAVAQRLCGSFSRGDRVKAHRGCRGARSGGAAGRAPIELESGEQGTVVGPGHCDGHVLVHFDSDERVWSLLPSQLSLAAGGGKDMSYV